MAMLPVPNAMRLHGLRSESSKSSSMFSAYCHNNFRKPNVMVFEPKAECRRYMKRVERIPYGSQKQKAVATPGVSVVKTSEKAATYRFRTEFGDRIRVVVEKKYSNKYGVRVELESLQFFSGVGEPVMLWGLFVSDSTSLMQLDFQQSSVDGQCRTRFVGGALELEFEADLAPFYVSFQLESDSGSDSKVSIIRSHRNTNFTVPVGFGAGHPSPLGVSFLKDGSVNFALFSCDAESVVLCLYADATSEEPSLEIDLDPYINRSGNIWHALLYSPMPFVSYGYRCRGGVGNKDNRVLLDPYAKVIGVFGLNQPRKWLGNLCEEAVFDWSDEVRPNLTMEKMIVYRLNVGRFTKDKSSKLADGITGSFSAISGKLQHFKDLGVNAILLEPVFPFDEQTGPYFPLHFFSPDSLYGGDAVNVAKSMKDMVKKLHASGIEVLMEVVFTHTGEGGALNEIDSSYSCKIQGGEEESRSINALNYNHPIVQELILESLRYWVTEFHIDGFSFINASSLTRGSQSELFSRPPLVEAIALDPLLARVKIIADSWDPLEMQMNDVRFPHWQRWAEMNSKFSNDVKNFTRGRGLISELATRLCGSGDLFLAGRGPAFSLNYVTRNSGLTLVDLVSFSSSGELESELSWNCGEEGATSKTRVLETRLKQIRNLLFILFVSLGVPVLNMGDECGQSTGGSLAYTDRKPLDWNSLTSSFGVQITKFISFLSSLKMRRSDLLQNRSFLKEENIQWHGKMQSPPDWDDPDCKFLAVTLKVDGESKYGDLFIAFNAGNKSEKVSFPLLPDEENWVRLVDTALPFPGFFSEEGTVVDASVLYEMKLHSCVLLEARRLSLC